MRYWVDPRWRRIFDQCIGSIPTQDHEEFVYLLIFLLNVTIYFFSTFFKIKIYELVMLSGILYSFQSDELVVTWLHIDRVVLGSLPNSADSLTLNYFMVCTDWAFFSVIRLCFAPCYLRRKLLHTSVHRPEETLRLYLCTYTICGH